jgi:hypothetical protein
MRLFSASADKYITFVGKVTKIDNFMEKSSTQKAYTLHFTSLSMDVNNAKRIRKFHSGTASEICSDLLLKHFGKEFIVLDKDKHTYKMVFPNLTPFQCINMMKSMAISEEYQDPGYLFWEDRDGFNFTSYSKLMEQDPIAKLQTQIADIKPTTKGDRMWLAKNIVFDPMMDTMENHLAGMYGQTLITYDKVNKSFSESTATYSSVYDKHIHVGKEKLTKRRVESPKHQFQFIVENQVDNPGTYFNLKDWAMDKPIRNQQLRGIRAHVVCEGFSVIKPGHVIEWPIKSNINEGAEDAVLSGNWLVTRIRHVVSRNEYFQHCEMIKDGIG